MENTLPPIAKQAIEILDKEVPKENEFEGTPMDFNNALVFGLYRIHNWLCSKTADETLMRAIVRDAGKKSISGAFNYVGKHYEDLARTIINNQKHLPGAIKVSNGIGLPIPDEAVFKLVREYYIEFDIDKYNAEQEEKRRQNQHKADNIEASLGLDEIRKRAEEAAEKKRKEEEAKKKKAEEEKYGLNLFDFS